MTCKCEIIEALAGWLGVSIDSLPPATRCEPVNARRLWEWDGRELWITDSGDMHWEGVELDKDCAADRAMVHAFLFNRKVTP